MAGGDRRELDEDPEPTAVRSPGRRSDDWLRSIRFWCRQRAQRKSAWVRRLEHYWLDSRVPHAEIRSREGLLAEDYARIRRWLKDAKKLSQESGGTVSLDEALLMQEDRQVDLVTRFAILKRAGANRDAIRTQLRLTHDGYDLTSEWYRDALAATRREARGQN